MKGIGIGQNYNLNDTQKIGVGGGVGKNLCVLGNFHIVSVFLCVLIFKNILF